jgi:hypothetical protein
MFMKTKLFITFIVLMNILTACQPAAPLSPLIVKTNAEFTLAPDQTATITDTGLTIRLIGVAGDERCPSGIECAASGPVSISLSVQIGDGDPTNINLQTFTSNDGRSPDMQFEGIKDRVVFEGYLIRVTGVLPYPASLSKTIKDSEYRVSLTVTKE